MKNKLRLRCINGNATLRQSLGRDDMDPTTKKILKLLKEAERKRSELDREIENFRHTLEMVGALPIEQLSQELERAYVAKQPFAGMSLADTCKTILRDHRDRWLSKAQIEYMVFRGGYKSTAKDPKSSVGTTLQRLAKDGFCDPERKRGAEGNRYRYTVPVAEHLKDLDD